MTMGNKIVRRAVLPWRPTALPRWLLLASVSGSALLLTAPADAGSPPLFSQQWYAARVQAARTLAASGGGTAATPNVQAQSAQQIADLSKMAAAIRAAQAVQGAALAAAASAASSVPNGLGAGGLDPVAGATAGSTLWIGAALPTQTTTDSRTTVTVNQTQSKALLNWKTFNVGAQTDLIFNQNNDSTWVALNKVTDPAARPSQILGSIKAPGKVFVLNGSGVIFGAGSQVNVGSLLASTATLPATVSTSASGTTTVDFSILSATTVTATGTTYVPSLTGASESGSVEVAAGAVITTRAPAAAALAGGYVMLLGGNVRNSGSIATPDGQIVLAAGTDFTMRPGFAGVGQANEISTTRGIEVATTGNGTAVNDGIVSAARGDITLVGRSVAQNGVALNTTSVDWRGTIHLLTPTDDETATVTLGDNSVTAILPDESGATATDAQRDTKVNAAGSLNALRAAGGQLRLNNSGSLADRLDLSRIEITTGGGVEFAGGALALAQGGQIAIGAAGRVLVGSGAALDVAGSANVSVPISQNILAISVQRYEQRDAPVNRVPGNLNSSTVYVDARDLVLVPASTVYASDRYYTQGGLLEVSGYLSGVSHTIGEWTAPGGTITVAGQAVVAQSASTFSVAGGSLAFQGGTVRTSYVQADDGSLFDINTASATRHYRGVYSGETVSHPRWSVSETFRNPLIAPTSRYEDGYTSGRDAGSLILSAPTVIFSGTIDASVYAGITQTTARAAGISDAYKVGQTAVSLPGTLAIGNYNAAGLADAFATSITIDSAPSLDPAAEITMTSELPAALLNTANLAAETLNAANLGGLSLTTRGTITLKSPVTLAPGGSAAFVAPAVEFRAGVTARSGRVVATNLPSVGVGNAVSTIGSLLGATGERVRLGSGAVIDVRGIWTNARLDGTGGTGAAFVNGGGVTLDTTGALTLRDGSIIDASAGAVLLSPSGTIAGVGGNVTLVSGDPSVSGFGTLTLAGVVRAFGVGGAGTLKLVAPQVTVGGPVTGVAGLRLDPGFFQNGFATYDVTGVSGVTIADGTVVQAAAPALAVVPESNSVPSGTDPERAMQLLLPPLYTVDPQRARLTQRQGVSLMFRADANVGDLNVVGGPLMVGAGAVLAVDPGRAIRLEAYNQITVEGTLSAPGGGITIVNTRNENPGLFPTFYPGLSIWLGEESRLDVSARAFTAQDTAGRSFGVVPAGGTITVGSDGGAFGSGVVISTDALVILRPGAELDASGTSAVIDPRAGTVPALTGAFAGPAGPTTVASNGGTISFSSYDGLYLDGAMRARSGGGGAAGGTLSLTLEAPIYLTTRQQDVRSPPDYLRRPRRIVISQETSSDLGTLDLKPGEATPATALQTGRISAAQIRAGGFDSVSLFARDRLQFDGNVSLSVGGSIALRQGVISATDRNETVDLRAPYVLLSGQSARVADTGLFDPSLFGSAITRWRPSLYATDAVFSVSADLIDLRDGLRFGVQGSVALNGTTDSGDPRTLEVRGLGFKNINLTSAGDIRFLGSSTGDTAGSTFVTPGNITFTAAQLYPTTNARAQVYAGIDYSRAGRNTKLNNYDQGSIVVRGNGAVPTAPFSLFGTLLLAAQTVDQGGVLRAPGGSLVLGSVYSSPVNGLGQDGSGDSSSFTETVILRPGSITSVSLEGLTVPYGGTTDGLTYTYAGGNVPAWAPSVSLRAQSVNITDGSTLDLSGGGELAGAGFISGRGGSVNTLVAPLLRISGGTYTPSTNGIYAIVPGYTGAYAPVAPLDTASYANGGGFSSVALGSAITIADGVPGLPAGTYTLLPAYYALLPGAFRVEIGGSSTRLPVGATMLADGSFGFAAYRKTNNTSVQSALPVSVTLTPADVVRTLSQFNEETYSQFQVAQSVKNGVPRSPLPADAGTVNLIVPSVNGAAPALTVSGTVLFAPGDSGRGGTATVQGANATAATDLVIVGAGDTADTEGFAISDDALNRLGAARLVIGGRVELRSESQGQVPTAQILNVTAQGASISSVTVQSGAVLRAPEVILVANSAFGTGAITVQGGATIDSIGRGSAPFDSGTGYFYDSAGNAVVAVSNGRLELLASGGSDFSGAVTIADGAALLSEGSLAFVTQQQLSIGTGATYGGRYIAFTINDVNIGEADALASATVPVGLQLSQAVLTRLLAGDPSSGAPALVSLTLTANQRINLFGAVTFSTGGSSGLQELDINAPAIYGFGNSGDVATIRTGTLVWNGIGVQSTLGVSGQSSYVVSQLPGGTITNGPGTGSGQLVLQANTLILGYPDRSQAQNNDALDRLILGFAGVTLDAAAIVAANKGSLSVYESQTEYGQPGTGGDLTLSTALLTGRAAAQIAITAGGALHVAANGSVAPTGIAGLGAEIDLKGESIDFSTTVALPSGRLVATAQGDVAFLAGATLALGGTTTTLFDQELHSAGGHAVVESVSGNVTEDAASVIDVSANGADAGSIGITATAGTVALNGSLLGESDSTSTAGSIDVRAGTLSDFVALNSGLDAGGITGRRAFQIKSGDLEVAGRIVANAVSISVDGGSLTVTGVIDASGAKPGTIELSARDNLVVSSGATLDAHANVLRVDSYGAPIDASNTPHLTLTTTAGRLQLQAGATLNVASADAVARGQIALNAPRVGTNDVAVDAGGPLNISGAASIAVYGWRSYTAPVDPGTGKSLITQAYLDGIDSADTKPFMALARANAALAGRLAGLNTATSGQAHLRPGVELVSGATDGDLVISGDINLADWRYGPNATGNGAGEPGAIAFRATGDLTVNGSVTDGFGTPIDGDAAAGTLNPDDNGWVLLSGGERYGADVQLPAVLDQPITLDFGTRFPTNSGVTLNFDITINRTTVDANNVLPVDVVSDSRVRLPASNWTATGAIRDGNGNVLYSAGDVIPGGTVFEVGTTFGKGTVLPVSFKAAAGTVWPAGTSLRAFGSAGSVGLFDPVTLTGGEFLPANSILRGFSGSIPVRPVNADGRQGQIWAVAPMLPAGTLSWSLSLVSGADTSSASRLAVQPSGALGGGGDLVLSDTHYSLASRRSPTSAFSVVRTGTGSLDLRSGGDFTEYSLYGVYTAGSQSAGIDAAYQLPQATSVDGTVLGSRYDGTYNSYVSAYQSYYPTGGGDLSLFAQGNIRGDIYGSGNPSSQTPQPNTDWTGNWLWRQGGSGEGLTDQPTAWWINFGTYVLPYLSSPNTQGTQPVLTGFTGIGTLGGGNLTVEAGGDAGVITSRGDGRLFGFGVGRARSDGLVLAVGGTGRVTDVQNVGGVVTGGSLVQTGGGDLVVRIGGALNGPSPATRSATTVYDGLNGTVTDLRGDISIAAGQIGAVIYTFGAADVSDPRAGSPYAATTATAYLGGLIVSPGDGTIDIRTMRDVVIAGASDPGRGLTQNLPGFTYAAADGSEQTAGSGLITSFSLWTAGTAINVFSAGGSAVPSAQRLNAPAVGASFSNDVETDNRFVYPATLKVQAPSGDIIYGAFGSAVSSGSRTYSLELAPSPQGELELLAGKSVYGANFTIDMSGASNSPDLVANPFKPVFSYSVIDPDTLETLASGTNAYSASLNLLGPYFAFGPDTPTGNLHASDVDSLDGSTIPNRIYAGQDIVGVRFGEVLNFDPGSGVTPSTWYLAAKPAAIEAGRDIVALGPRPATEQNRVPANFYQKFPNLIAGGGGIGNTYASGSLFLNLGTNDVSVISAGRDILESYAYVAGPGLLTVTAGRNLDQENLGIIKSIGPVFNVNPLDRTTGAGISIQVGTGTGNAAFDAFAKLYFDAANTADPAFQIDSPQNEGKVQVTYATELLAWLKANEGYTGTADDALAFFISLPADQKDVLVRKVFFEELKASGREFNDPTSRFYKSYQRGRQAIGALFPAKDASGADIAYVGGITMFSGTDVNGATVGSPAEQFDAGISTLSGGTIQVLAPGGQVLLGTSSLADPGSNTGLITFGSGDVQTYSTGSVLLGKSRVFATFGGSIQMWSAQGDINAGVGSKTSVIYQPPIVSYDEAGGLTFSPSAPTSGAGIATLASVPGVPLGDVDLVAPLGTIDAGEAGIRVSGNLNIAALTVVNAANVQVGGKSTGTPTIAVANVGALNAASATSAAAAAAANAAANSNRNRDQQTASVITVDVLGFGE